MTLTDAGPLLALLDRNDPAHDRCAAELARLSAPMLTTWPAFTETCYLLGVRLGWHAQDCLLGREARGDVLLAESDPQLRARSRSLMRKYSDLPMDLADATLVAVAEAQDMRRIFTLDRDFEVYRLRGRTPFDIVTRRAG